MKASMELTLRWAERSKKYFEDHKHEVPWREAGEGARSTQSLFGIVQGGMDLELRKESAERTIEIGFPGYAIGGLPSRDTRQWSPGFLRGTPSHLPPHKPPLTVGGGPS